MRYKIINGLIISAILVGILYYGADAIDATITVLRYH